jgi:hypothetical protein
MPANLRPDAYTSFGHFTSTSSPVLAWMPSAMATPAATVSNVVARRGSTPARAGARTVETYNPLPGGENHVRPRRPRPDVWAPATTTVPSVAIDAASSFVDPMVEKNSSRAASGARRGRASSIAHAMSSGRGSTYLGFFVSSCLRG